MMLGESMAGVGAGALQRPRSADNLARLAPASSLPALDDLAESEVFVGDEDEDMCGGSNEVVSSDEVKVQVSSVGLELPLVRVEQVGQVEQAEQVGGTCQGLGQEPSTPDLASPTAPGPTSGSCMVITYHDESLRLPLDAVKEEVEAEALEEASMIYSSGPASLGHASLASSVVSTASLDETLSSRTDTFDTVVAAPSHLSNASSPTPSTPTPPRPNHRDAVRVSSTSARTSPTSPRGSSGRSSPRTNTESPPTPERRRRTPSTPRTDTSRGSTPRASAMRSVPRTPTDRSKEEKKTPLRTTPRGAAAPTDRRTTARGPECRREMDRPGTHTRTRTAEADRSEDSRSSTLGRRKKPETKDAKSEADTKYGLMGRKKTDRDDLAERTGTLGRRRKAKEACDTKDYGKDRGGLSKDSKNTLDMYATLPRRKAREMSAAWREQMAAEDEAKTSLRRSKSIGKSESNGSSVASGRSRGSVMSSSLPPSALAGLSSARSRSPRGSHRDVKTATTSTATRKERTIICMETSVQTCLTGGDVSTALRALSRQNSAATEDEGEKPDARPHVTIIRETPPPEPQPDRRHVEVQVELAWRLGDGELPEHVRRLTDEHTRLQTEHARARARLDDLEHLREDLEKTRKSLVEERSEKEEVQSELDKTSERVRDMLTSMEGVEQEFNNRGDSLIELETQLHQSADIHIQMQDKLNQYEEYAIKIKRDLDKSVAAQKTLLQQVQDLENEGREIADFMSEEKNALAECLREAEQELGRVRGNYEDLSKKFEQKDDEARHMVRLAEENRNKFMVLQAEMNSMKSKARDMMVCQGAEVSSAAVSLTNLSMRLHTLIGKLVQDYSITDTDLEMIVTPSESDSSASSTNGTPERKSPYKVSARTPSPRKTASFITALLNAMRGGPRGKTSPLGSCNGIKQETEGRNSPEGSESHDLVEHDGSSSSGGSNLSLADQVTEVDVLLTRFLKVCCVLKNDTDNRLTEIEEENERLCNQIRSQQQVIDQQHSDYETLNRSESRAKRELMVVARELEMANQKLNKFYQADYEIQVKKLEDEVERLSTTVRHLEALHEEKEKQLAESLASLSSAQGPAPPNHVPEATHRQEVATLNDKVASLRQSVIERDRRISELSERHSQDLASIRDAQVEGQRSNRRLTATVEHVLKTLESVPDIVSGSTTLKQLFATLAAADKTNMQQLNGNANTHNGFGNTVNNRDLNANPQSIMGPAINTKKIVSNLKAETHL